jgi:hypothetical protein
MKQGPMLLLQLVSLLTIADFVVQQCNAFRFMHTLQVILAKIIV